MLKKLSEEKLNEILETGIREFAENGLEGTSIANVAKKAGISVGVLYKYYADKEAFFQACLKKSLSVLEHFVLELTSREDKLINYADAAIRAVQRYSHEYSDYVRMYNRVTVSGDKTLADELAVSIEGLTSSLFTGIVERAAKEGYIRQDAETDLFAFFFDNLMMMLQFTYCCPYYMARYRLYTGNDVNCDDERVRKQLLRFLESAFTFEEKDVVHS